MTEDKDLTIQMDTPVTDPGMVIDMAQDTLEEFLTFANVDNVYGKPVKNGDTIVIPAAEVVAGMGFGAGYGVSPGDQETPKGSSGAGGGGQAFARPVAVIVAGPEGVRVDPVIDTTKIALTALTAIGFMVSTIQRMSRGK